jgi:hypothetical protein
VRCRRVGWHVAMSAPTEKWMCMCKLAGFGSAEGRTDSDRQEAAAGGGATCSSSTPRSSRASRSRQRPPRRP